VQNPLHVLFLACFTVTRCTVARCHRLFHACYTKVFYAVSRAFSIILKHLMKTDEKQTILLGKRLGIHWFCLDVWCFIWIITAGLEGVFGLRLLSRLFDIFGGLIFAGFVTIWFYAVLNLFDGEISITQTQDPLECKKSIQVKKLRNKDYIKTPICLTKQ